jgi:hypothetical protein
VPVDHGVCPLAACPAPWQRVLPRVGVSQLIIGQAHIDDKSTLQVGLGRVPNQMLYHLRNRRDLAIHSDVVTEPVAEWWRRCDHRPGHGELG